MWKNLFQFFLFFIILNIFFYVLFSFIAWTLNPMEWWLLQSTSGRCALVIFEVMLFKISDDFIFQD